MTVNPQSGVQTSRTASEAADGLESLHFLEGDWHSDGQGPYGPYELDATTVIRGRWLLMTYEISPPDSQDVFYVSTQVYGYDNDGLVLELFDTAGAFTFRGMPLDDGGVRFDWSDGDSWKRSEFHPNGAHLDFQYDSMEPDSSNQLSTFAGIWTRGLRTA